MPNFFCPTRTAGMPAVDTGTVTAHEGVVFICGSEYPSIQWAGKDIANELARYFRVAIRPRYDGKSAGRTNIYIKLPPGKDHVREAKNRGQKIFYSPIDYFTSQQAIEDHRDVLEGCAGIFLHSQSLLPHFEKFAPVHVVEHYSKYVVREARPYRKDGFILWIGFFEHIAYLFSFLKANKLPHPVRCLSNAGSHLPSRKLGIQLVREMGLESELKKYEIGEWSPERQYEMMKEAKAAIDIKGVSFKQIHKPPTKIQQYLLSGIPPAINSGCNSYDYVKSQGFPLCTPAETDRWLSEGYWEEANRYAVRLKEVCSLEKVGERYRDIIMNRA